VKNTTPFLTGFSALFHGRSKRSVQAVLSGKRHALLEGGIDIPQQLRDEIPPDLLENHSQSERTRAYPDELVFWAFLLQVSSDDSSCVLLRIKFSESQTTGNSP
jgi:hypothetical protein